MASLDGVVLLAGATLIEWTVADGNGLIAICQFTITVATCTSISGTIFWQGDGVTGVNNADVTLTGGTSDSDTTDSSGDYTLVANLGDDCVITPKKGNQFTLNGVTAADASAIQQHLSGAQGEVITDFFRLVAADLNKSNTISIVDAALIRQGILGNPSALAILNTTGDWRFVGTAYPDVLTNIGPYVLTDFSAYEQRTLAGVAMDMAGQDFWAVKVGDVFEQTLPGVDIADPALKPDPSARPLVWRVRDRVLQAGEPVELDFSVVNFTDIAAFQHGMRFDPAVLQYEAMHSTTTEIPLDAAGNFGAYRIAAGELRTLWSVAEGVTLPGVQPMYRLHFTALQGGMKLSEVVSFDPAVLRAVAYTTALAPREVQLVFTDYKNTGLLSTDNQVDIPNTGFDLLQNRPNPFSDRTTIGFILPEACAAQLRVFDISGRELWRSDETYPAGYHEVVLRLEELPATGMLFYELTTPQGKQTRRMLAVGM
ncbi:MAG: T9SS type A sorting domain-containing protein [Lewinellaceae bacterium]|nr:T9SS type A sorting domain-containing protein [Lewinellaceae bacterium]